MATTIVYTRVDMTDHLLDVMGPGTADEVMLRKVKRAVDAAYREIVNSRAWTYFHTIRQMRVNAHYNTGTIEYTHASRLLTLTDGVFPTWAKYGYIRIDKNDYEVETRLSDTTLTLSINSNPGEDIAALTDYEIARDTYPLPVDIQSIGLMRDPVELWYPGYLPPNEFMSVRCTQEGPGNPRNYTIISDHNYLGTMAIRFYPAPDQNYRYEYMARRTPRQFSTYKYDAGSLSISGTTVTGVDTAWTQSMIGCVLRLSASTFLEPTGSVGSNPYPEQRIITGWFDENTLEIDQATSGTYTGVKYEISDPIDLESGAMYTAFLRRCEHELAVLMQRKDVDRYEMLARRAEITAFEGDDRVFDQGGEGIWRLTPLRWTVQNE